MIKLFEEYNEYYEVITSIQYESGLHCQNVQIDYTEINIIRKLFPFPTFVERFKNKCEKMADSYRYQINFYVDYDFKKFILDISKIEDDWYYIFFYPWYCENREDNIYYKCDQLDGLVHCISDLIKVEKLHDKTI